MGYHEVGKNMSMHDMEAKACEGVEYINLVSVPLLVNFELLVIFYQKRYSQISLVCLLHPRLMWRLSSSYVDTWYLTFKNVGNIVFRSCRADPTKTFVEIRYSALRASRVCEWELEVQ